VGIRCASD